MVTMSEAALKLNDIIAQLYESSLREADLLSKVSLFQDERLEWERKLRASWSEIGRLEDEVLREDRSMRREWNRVRSKMVAKEYENDLLTAENNNLRARIRSLQDSSDERDAEDPADQAVTGVEWSRPVGPDDLGDAESYHGGQLSDLPYSPTGTATDDATGPRIHRSHDAKGRPVPPDVVP